MVVVVVELDARYQLQLASIQSMTHTLLDSVFHYLASIISATAGDPAL